MLGHIVSRTATELLYYEKSSYMKDITAENKWRCELRKENGIDVPIFIIVGFLQRDQFIQQHRKNDTFYRPSVVKAQAIIGSEKYPDAGNKRKNATDKNSQAYGEIVFVLDI